MAGSVPTFSAPVRFRARRHAARSLPVHTASTTDRICKHRPETAKEKPGTAGRTPGATTARHSKISREARLRPPERPRSGDLQTAMDRIRSQYFSEMFPWDANLLRQLCGRFLML